MKKIMILAACAAACSAYCDICVKDGETVAFMGDSITQFGNGTSAGYVNLVMKGLEVAGVKNAKKIPAGISGHKSTQMSERLDRDVLNKKPQWMTFSCGVNDVWHGKNGVPLEKYKELVSGIFDKALASNVNVIVLTPTMIGEDPSNANNKLLDEYVAWIREEAGKRNLRLADLNADMKAELAKIRETDKSSGNKLTRDGVHMAFPGDCMMAWGILKAMGVEDSQKDAVYAAFRKQPGAYKKEFLFSAEEWDIIKDSLARGGGDAAYFIDLVKNAPAPKLGGNRTSRMNWAATVTEARVFKASSGMVLPYRWHEPAKDLTGKYPLVIFLHGAGERGNNNISQMIHSVPEILDYADRSNQPLFLVAGQVPNGAYEGDPQGIKWVQVPWNSAESHVLPEVPSAPMAALIELIAKVREDPRVDTSRVYVTGLSMGGYGTWDFVMRNPDWVAAFMPLCGGADESKMELVKNVACRIIHGGADTVVPTVRGRRAYEALKAVGGNVEYTEYPGVGHGCWGPAFADETILEWMFKQKK